jgi:hypothetical protein
MTTMFDTVNAVDVPLDAVVVAGYVDGHWPSFDAMVKRVPGALHVSITVTGVPGARVLDWERGNADPPQWARGEIAAGRRPTIYCSKDNVAAVAAAIRPLLFVTNVDLWDADWTGIPHRNPLSVATQYAHNVAGCDLSLTNGVWPGVPANPTDPVDTQTHYDALVPGPGGLELAVIGKFVGPGGLYRGRQVTPGVPVYAGTGNPTTWAQGFVVKSLPAGTPLAVPLANAGQTSTVISTVVL